MRYTQARQNLLFGAGAVTELPGELRELSARRVCLIGGRSAMAGAAGAAVRAALDGFEVTGEFDRVRPHAPIADTEELARALSAQPPDALVAVGGGSASDTAKGVSILLAEGFPLEDRCSTFRPPDVFHHVQLNQPKIPVLSVPTTMSGAEITPGGGATNAAGIKRVFWDPKVASRVVVYDPDLLRDVPVMTLLTTAMNGLAHCAEALYSRTASPVTDGLAREGARRFAAALPRLAADGAAAGTQTLTDVQVAAGLGGLVISNARVGLHHAICHVLGAAFGVPHGVANSVMLPYVLEFNLDATMAKQAILADALAEGLGGPPGRSAAHLVALVQARTGVPHTLAAAGVDEKDLDRVAEDVLQDRGLFFNPKRVTSAAQVRDVLQRAFTGELSGEAS